MDNANQIAGNIAQPLLQTLVPVNALTVDHLYTLMRDQSIEAVCRGQTLFKTGDYDNHNVYLLSGVVSLTDSMGLTKRLSADDPASRYALVDYQPRRCTAMAETDCSIIRFNSDQLDAMLAWDQASSYIMLDIASQRDLDEDADWMLTLLKSNLFYKVPPMNIRQILNKFESIYVSSGDTVIRQGQMGDSCYFIKEGLAGVYQSESDRSPSTLVAEMGVGRCFGEDSLIHETVRNATITMHSNGVLMRLDKQDFFLLLKSPAINCLNLSEAKNTVTDNACWLDVRTQDEFEKGHYLGAVNMPLNLLKLKSRMLDKDKHYLLYCNSGRRSEAAAYLLGQDGFNSSLLAGGVASYSTEEQKHFENVAVF